MKIIFRFILPFLLPLPLMGQQPGDTLFGSSIIHEIRITFQQNGWWDTLINNKLLSDQTGNDIYIPATVSIDGNLLDSVGVKLKGNSSFNNPGRKKPLKLSFNEYIGGQKYDGLKAIHLNNSAYDPTMLREKLMLDVLNRHHLPAPRCTFTTVYFNGNYVGLYSVIELPDKTFLKTHFGENNGNLFKGDPAGNLRWNGSSPSNYFGSYELKTNPSQNDWSDLIDLIDRINNSGNYFPESIRQRLDVDNFLWTLAANNLFVNLDSYVCNPHNYYLYDDSTDGKFHWISWDVGLSFGIFPLWMQSRSQSLDVFYLPNPPDNVPLTKHLFNSDEFRKIYLDAMCTLLNEDFAPHELFPKIDSLATRIRPYVYAEPDSNKMYTTAQFEGNLGYTSYSPWIASSIPGLKQFIAQRSGDVASQLCTLGWSCSSGTFATSISGDGIHVYPNPSDGMVTVFFDSPYPGSSIYYRLSDAIGNIVFQENVTLENGIYSRTIDMRAKASGIYVLRVIGGCKEIEQKIVIVH